MSVWMEGRDNITGWARPLARERQGTDAAKELQRQIIALAEERGRGATAERLKLAGAPGDPGLDEVYLLAECLGGQVVVYQVSDDQPHLPGVQCVYGGGKLVALLELTYHDGPVDPATGIAHRADHWIVLQSWFPRESKSPDHRCGISPDILEKRCQLPGAGSSDNDFEDFFSELGEGIQSISREVPDALPTSATILSETETHLKYIKEKKAGWSTDVQRLALGAFAVYRLRLTDVFVREYCMLLHICLDDGYLIAHGGIACFWNENIRFMQKYEGLLSEGVFKVLKEYLLRLEGLLRSFCGGGQAD